MANDTARQLTPLELKRKISLDQAAEMNSLSRDTFRRYYPHLIRRISPRRVAVELGDALDLPPPPTPALRKRKIASATETIAK